MNEGGGVERPKETLARPEGVVESQAVRVLWVRLAKKRVLRAARRAHRLAGWDYVQVNCDNKRHKIGFYESGPVVLVHHDRKNIQTLEGLETLGAQRCFCLRFRDAVGRNDRTMLVRGKEKQPEALANMKWWRDNVRSARVEQATIGQNKAVRTNLTVQRTMRMASGLFSFEKIRRDVEAAMRTRGATAGQIVGAAFPNTNIGVKVGARCCYSLFSDADGFAAGETFRIEVVVRPLWMAWHERGMSTIIHALNWTLLDVIDEEWWAGLRVARVRLFSLDFDQIGRGHIFERDAEIKQTPSGHWALSTWR